MVTPSGITIVLIAEQPLNAAVPMVVRVEGRVIEVMDAQPLNAAKPISVTPSGITSSVTRVPLR